MRDPEAVDSSGTCCAVAIVDDSAAALLMFDMSEAVHVIDRDAKSRCEVKG